MIAFSRFRSVEAVCDRLLFSDRSGSRIAKGNVTVAIHRINDRCHHYHSFSQTFVSFYWKKCLQPLGLLPDRRRFHFFERGDQTSEAQRAEIIGARGCALPHPRGSSTPGKLSKEIFPLPLEEKTISKNRGSGRGNTRGRVTHDPVTKASKRDVSIRIYRALLFLSQNRVNNGIRLLPNVRRKGVTRFRMLDKNCRIPL